MRWKHVQHDHILPWRSISHTALPFGFYSFVVPRGGRLAPGDELVFAAGSVFHLMGGIQARGLVNVTVRFDATLVFCDALLEWPRGPGGGVLECLDFGQCSGLKLTSSAEWVPPTRKVTEG